MSLKVIGSGLGRTGTHSLKVALEILLGAPCYHMVEVFKHPEHIPVWQAAAEGKSVDWDSVFQGYSATVDWPSAAYYKELVTAYPDAMIVHSHRDPESWWKSASSTIFSPESLNFDGDRDDWRTMLQTMMARTFTPHIYEKDAATLAFKSHNTEVLATVPRERLILWTASEGWGPLCEGLGLPVPNVPFPVTNTTEEFRSRLAAK